MLKIKIDTKWGLGFLVALLGLYIAWQQFQIARIEQKLKINPIIDAKFEIVGNRKCDLIISNNGMIPVEDVYVYLWPRLFHGPSFEVISSTGGKYPWKTIEKLAPDNKKLFNIEEDYLNNSVRNQLLIYKNQKQLTGPFFPVLLVDISYRRPVDKKLFAMQKYLYVGKDAKTGVPIPFDLDENPLQCFIELREAAKRFDELRLGMRRHSE